MPLPVLTLLTPPALAVPPRLPASPCGADCTGFDAVQPGRAAVEDEDPDSCATVVASNYDLRLELFSVGDDGTLYHKGQAEKGAGWHPWAAIEDTPPHVGGLGVVRANDRLVAALCGTDGSLHLSAQAEPSGQTGKWTSWRAIGGPPGGCKRRPTLAIGPSAALHLFAVAEAGQLWESAWPWDGAACDYRQLFLFESTAPPLATGCGAWALLGGEATDAPSAVVSAGQLNIFVRGPGGALFQKAQLATRPPAPEPAGAGTAGRAWGNWSALSAGASETPRLPAVTGGMSLVELFYRGADHELYELRQAVRTQVPDAQSQRGSGDAPGATEWSDPQPLGGVVASGPAAGVNIDGLAQVAALGPDRTVWHKRQVFNPQTLSPGWQPWGSLGGEASSGPTLAVRADGLLDVFVRGADRNLYRKPQLFDAANGTEGTNGLRWGSWEFLGGPVRTFPC